jgi:hypothetical protein
MRIIPYSAERYTALSRAIGTLYPHSALLHRPFVDYYYESSGWCSLYLAVDNQDEVVGTIGLERLRFAADSVPVELGFATSYYGLQAGAGGLLFVQWVKRFPAGLVFGGSKDTHGIIRAQHWKYYEGVNVYALNRRYPAYEGDSGLRRAGKRLIEAATRRRLAAYRRRMPDAASGVEVREQGELTADLLPRNSPFRFRFAPEAAYLQWRYNPALTFVRYRIFRILAGGATAGVVILKDDPEEIIVSYCDGSDPAQLAWGVLKAVFAISAEDVRPRAVVLSSSHPVMQRIFSECGFAAIRKSRPFAIGARRGNSPEIPSDPAEWLINFDIGDNGLRAPFLDQRRLRPQ